jgi:hypothetical protein
VGGAGLVVERGLRREAGHPTRGPSAFLGTPPPVVRLAGAPVQHRP